MSDAPQLVLASASPRRRELLAHLGVPYDVVSSDFNESSVSTKGLTPAEWVMCLAEGKARRVARQTSAHVVVIGADTTVVMDGEFLNKPKDEADARRMLRSLSGRTHQVFTGVCVLEGQHGTLRYSGTVFHVHTDFAATFVTFKTLTGPVIDAYVATREPMDKAGGYGIQGQGQSLVDSLDGDFYNVMGLPLELLRGLLLPFYPDILPAPPQPRLRG